MAVRASVRSIGAWRVVVRGNGAARFRLMLPPDLDVSSMSDEEEEQPALDGDAQVRWPTVSSHLLAHGVQTCVTRPLPTPPTHPPTHTQATVDKVKEELKAKMEELYNLDYEDMVCTYNDTVITVILPKAHVPALP